jgi:hypothetical protein
MTTSHHLPAGVTPFAIYEDPEDKDVVSPSEMFEGDLSFNAELLPIADEAIPSIELDDEPRPYRSSYTSRKSLSRNRRSSSFTHYSIVSAIPSEPSLASHPPSPATEAEPRYSPRKDRPRFRNPESVRAMQMSSPPLLPTEKPSRERLRGSYKLMTPSKSGRSETPVTRKSGSRRGSIREHLSPMPAPSPQQAPLVLLHVTLLPPQVPYSPELMARIMPDWLVENYKLLEKKLQDIFLMRRGVLIPHPRDEYDLLEERILESLELKTPRLLKCGHFVPPEDDSDKEDDEDDVSVREDNTGRGSRMSGGTMTEELEWKETVMDGEDASICTDCHHERKRPGKGIGAGTRRWDIKIYAANGLMRAAAWTACWTEMERCDVEVSPWIPQELRKTLERRVLEEQEAETRKQMYADELQRQIQEASSKQKIAQEEAAERKRLEEVELQERFEAAAAALQRSVEEKAAEKKRLEEAFEQKIEEAKEAVRLEVEARATAEANVVAERLQALEEALQGSTKMEAAEHPSPSTTLASESRPVSQSGPRQSTKIPLGTLLKNYLLGLVCDQRNIIIVVLSAAVVFLVMNMNPSNTGVVPTQLIESPIEDAALDRISTSTATTTATSFSTLTVTEVLTVSTVRETSVPLSGGAILVDEILGTETASQSDASSTSTGTAVDESSAEDSSSSWTDMAQLDVEDLLSKMFEPAASDSTPPASDLDRTTAHDTCPANNIFRTQSSLYPDHEA